MRGDWVLFKNKVHSMGPPGFHTGHRHQILWPEVGPFSAISAKFYGQWWAHSRPSGPYFMASGRPIQGHQDHDLWAHSRPLAPYFMASGGPIQGHRDHILWPEVGLFNAIGARFYGQWWAHPIFYGQQWAHPRPLGPYFMASGGPI